MGIGTMTVWPTQWTLWKLVRKNKVQVMFEVCLSPHYATICMELFKIEIEAKQES